jgi:transcriptional regulator GlxA family with amidase domain
VFTAAVGATPAAWVQRLRLEAARAALEASRRSVKEVAAACGFGRPESMHRVFRRELGSTPQEYRERFTLQRDAGDRSQP